MTSPGKCIGRHRTHTRAAAIGPYTDGKYSAATITTCEEGCGEARLDPIEELSSVLFDSAEKAKEAADASRQC